MTKIQAERQATESGPATSDLDQSLGGLGNRDELVAELAAEIPVPGHSELQALLADPAGFAANQRDELVEALSTTSAGLRNSPQSAARDGAYAKVEAVRELLQLGAAFERPMPEASDEVAVENWRVAQEASNLLELFAAESLPQDALHPLSLTAEGPRALEGLSLGNVVGRLQDFWEGR